MPEISIITIGGDAGSGKSTVALALALKTGFTRLNAGYMQRERCNDPKHNPKGLDLQAYMAQLSPQDDQSIEDEMKETARKKDRLIMEGRLSFSWVPHGKPVLKVFLSVDPMIGAKRILDQKQQSSARREERKDKTVEETLKDNEKRKGDEIERYKRVYGLNPYDLKQYDIIIDTSYQTPEEVVQQILNEANLDKGSTIYAGL
ncbi:MAG: (d)CMP kinase [Nanoarchaeota archaeon]